LNASIKYWLRDIGIVLAVSFGILFLLQLSFVKAQVVGESMEPSLYSGEQIMVNKLSYSFTDPKRGEVIIFTPPSQTGARSDYIKRVIGLPGETVKIKDGVVYIQKPDGESSIVLDEPYTASLAMFDYEGSTIPEGHYFVMGDNRNNSSDSRSGWTVPLENIVGKAWFIYWPFGDFGCAPHYSQSE